MASQPMANVAAAVERRAEDDSVDIEIPTQVHNKMMQGGKRPLAPRINKENFNTMNRDGRLTQQKLSKVMKQADKLRIKIKENGANDDLAGIAKELTKSKSLANRMQRKESKLINRQAEMKSSKAESNSSRQEVNGVIVLDELKKKLVTTAGTSRAPKASNMRDFLTQK